MIKILTKEEINNLKVIKENGDKISSTDFYELQSGNEKVSATEGKVSYSFKFTSGLHRHKLKNGEWNDYIIRPTISLSEIYKNNKYIRMTYTMFETYLKDKSYKAIRKNKEISWIKVEPIKWLVDTDKKIIIPKDILGNIQHIYIKNKYCEIKEVEKFLEEYFIKEIQQNKINSNIDSEKINDLIELMTMLYPKEKLKEKILKK